MDAELRRLVSRTITEAWQERGIEHLGFAHGAVLTVTWPHRFDRLPEARALAGLVGQRLVSLSTSFDRVVLEFSAGTRLTVEVEEERRFGLAGLYLTTRQGRVVEWRLFDEEAA